MLTDSKGSPMGAFKVVVVEGGFIAELLKQERINVTLHTDPELRDARVAGVIHQGTRLLVVFENPKWPVKSITAAPEVLVQLRSADV